MTKHLFSLTNKTQHVPFINMYYTEIRTSTERQEPQVEKHWIMQRQIRSAESDLEQPGAEADRFSPLEQHNLI